MYKVKSGQCFILINPNYLHILFKCSASHLYLFNRAYFNLDIIIHIKEYSD